MKKIPLIACLVMAGCVPIPNVKMTNGFDSASHDKYRANGTAKIDGQAFLKQRGGGVVTCAGNKVALSPDTEYFREYWSIIKRRAKPIEPEVQPGEQPVTKRTTCDAQGNFEFTNIAEGDWLLTTHVTWSVGYDRQGAILQRKIQIKHGASEKIFLSEEDRFANNR